MLEKNVYSVAFGWNVLFMSFKAIWFNVSFKASSSLLIVYLDNMCIGEGDLLKSSIIIVLLPLSHFRSVNVCFIRTGILLCLVHKYVQIFVGLTFLLLYSDLHCALL